MKSTCFISGANLFLSAGRYRGQKQVGVAPGYGCRNRNRARKKRYHEPCRRPHPPLTLRFGARNSNFPALKRGAGRTIGLAQNGTVEWYRFLRARWLSTFAFTGGCCVFGNETPTFSVRYCGVDCVHTQKRRFRCDSRFSAPESAFSRKT